VDRGFKIVLKLLDMVENLRFIAQPQSSLFNCLLDTAKS